MLRISNFSPETLITHPMSLSVVQTGFTHEAFEAFLESRGEPAWLVELRRQAWNLFHALPTPDTRQEEWRRTDLRLFRLDRFGPAQRPADGSPVPAAMLAERVDLGGRVVALDSHPWQASLDAKWRDRGVLFGSLDELALEHEALLRPHLQRRIVDPRADKFAALHAAIWSGGTLLYVPKGVAIDQPLHTLSAITPGGVDLGHTLVVLEDDAEATLLAETAGGEETPGLHCGAIEILVGRGARLRYVNLQNWGTGVWHFALAWVVAATLLAVGLGGFGPGGGSPAEAQSAGAAAEAGATASGGEGTPPKKTATPT
ncbi:MAG: SufD family Fe-S cluster assembly protein, partial [Thermoguttaceae bacterium]|nr:SufD family Fe-S cluster assembly protein [Thermoguttaceae bacterium]